MKNYALPGRCLETRAFIETHKQPVKEAERGEDYKVCITAHLHLSQTLNENFSGKSHSRLVTTNDYYDGGIVHNIRWTVAPDYCFMCFQCTWTSFINLQGVYCMLQVCLQQSVPSGCGCLARFLGHWMWELSSYIMEAAVLRTDGA